VADIDVGQVRDWLTRSRDKVVANREYLTALDSAIGDADHGINLSRGLKAVIDKVEASNPETINALLQTSGMTLVSTVGGASGPLFGTLLLRMAKAVGDADHASGAQFADALQAGLDGVVARGKAELEDKTMVDAFDPAVKAFAAAIGDGSSPADAAVSAAKAAAEGRDATEPLVARKGRASYLGERSAGHLDPGAASIALLMEALAEALAAVA
jgi:phosphoenolpyruvate---glycerone phosphotransferase subunit DhaL